MSSILVTPPLPSESVINSLNPREAVHDTPNFRANVKKFEEQIDHFEKWLDALFKAIKSYSEESIKLNEASNNLAKKATLTPNEEPFLDREFTHTAVRIFADILQTTYAFKAKLVNDIDEKLLQPITHFVKNDLKEFKESRRNYERTLERYDSMLAKYTSQSKNKEASALREDAFQLYEVRKNYIRVALDYTLKIVQFRTSIDHLVTEQFLTSTFIHLDMYEASLIVHKGSENQLERLKGWLSESKKTCENQNPILQDLRKKLEEEAINSNKPRRNLTKYTDGGMTIHPNSDALQTARPSSPTNETPAKQGYLFMRANGKNTWVRKYFYLKDGIFWWTSVGHGKNRSNIEESEKTGVLLCEVRIDTSQDRRFCFEVFYGAKQTTYLLQAETEQELKDWISAFENAKRYASRSSNDPSASDTSVIPNKETEDDEGDHDTNKPSSSNSVEGYKIDGNSTLDLKAPPLAKKRASSVSVSNLPNSRPSLVAHHTFSPSSKGSTTPLINNNTATTTTSSTIQPSSNEKSSNEKSSNEKSSNEKSSNEKSSNEKSSTSANQQNFWGTLNWAMPAVNLIMNTGNAHEDEEDDGDGSKRNGSGPVGSGADGSIAEYPHNLLLHNVQLHILFSCATEAEYVLDIFNCAWYKDNMLFKGRAYITQDKLYFYSTVMSVINMFWISWRDIKSIVYKTTETQQIVEFINNTSNQNYIIKTYLDTKGVFYEKANTVWSLSTGEKSVSLQNIFNAVWKLENGPKTEKKNDTVPEKNKEQKDENSTIDEKLLEKAEVKDQKSGNLDDRKDLITQDKVSVNDTHEKDNKTPDTPRTPSMIIIPSPEDDLPSSIPSPKDPIKCHCPDHLEKIEFEHEFPVSAKKLFDIMFDEQSTLWSRLHKKKGNTLTHSGPWVMDNGERKREFKFIMPVNNPMTKVKESNCIETQVCKKRDDYLCYSVLTQTKALDIPYNDSFVPMIKFCITYISKTSCKLTCYIGIKWFKSPMVKAIIRKATMSGLSETVADIMSLVNADIAQRKLLDPGSPRSHQGSSLRRRSHSHRHHKSRSKLISGEELQAVGTSANKVSTGPLNEQKKSKKANSFTMEDLIELLDKSISTFIEMATNLPSIRIIVGIILTLSLLFNIYLSMGIGYNSPSVTATATGIPKTNITPPAVYIRDIEEYVLNTSSKALKGVDPTSYRQFLDTRIVHPPYPWLLHFHRRMSDEISFARKKVAILRYDLLLTFRLINSIDKRLSESEYVNWLLDERAKCNKARWMLLKDDLLSEEEEIRIGNESDENSLYDNEKHEFSNKYKSEHKSIMKYCKDVKKQLDVFS